MSLLDAPETPWAWATLVQALPMLRSRMRVVSPFFKRKGLSKLSARRVSSWLCCDQHDVVSMSFWLVWVPSCAVCWWSSSHFQGTNSWDLCTKCRLSCISLWITGQESLYKMWQKKQRRSDCCPVHLHGNLIMILVWEQKSDQILDVQ